MNIQEIEDLNRSRVLDILNNIPHGVPVGWSKTFIAVGGLLYIGFSDISTEKLLCISSQKQTVISCNTGEVHLCNGSYDEGDLIALSDKLGEEIIRIAGIGGGGLRRYSKSGDILEVVYPYYPKNKVVFMPNYNSYFKAPEKCTIIFDDYEVMAYGFSKCGNYMVIATSSDLSIFKREFSN